MKQFLRLLTLFLLFGLPFVVFPLGISHYEIPKVITAQICMELIIVLQLLQVSAIRKTCTLSQIFPYLILFILSIVALLFFQTKFMFFGNQFRMQGIFLFWHLLLFSFFAPKISFDKMSSKFLFFFLLLQTAGALFMQQATSGRAVGFLGEPNALAAIAVFVFPLLLFQKTKKSFVWISSLLFMFLILFLSGSRSGFVALILETVSFFLFTKTKISAKYALMTCLVLYLGTLFTPFFASDLHESRLEIWYASLISFTQHPLIGGGFGNIDTLIHAGTKTYASFISARYVDSAHNIFLDFALQGGIIGLFAFCSLVVAAFAFVFRKKRYIEFTMLLGFLVVLSFNPASVWTLVVFWFLIGQANEGTVR